MAQMVPFLPQLQVSEEEIDALQEAVLEHFLLSWRKVYWYVDGASAKGSHLDYSTVTILPVIGGEEVAGAHFQIPIEQNDPMIVLMLRIERHLRISMGSWKVFLDGRYLTPESSDRPPLNGSRLHLVANNDEELETYLRGITQVFSKPSLVQGQWRSYHPDAAVTADTEPGAGAAAREERPSLSASATLAGGLGTLRVDVSSSVSAGQSRTHAIREFGLLPPSGNGAASVAAAAADNSGVWRQYLSKRSSLGRKMAGYLVGASGSAAGDGKAAVKPAGAGAEGGDGDRTVHEQARAVRSGTCVAEMRATMLRVLDGAPQLADPAACGVARLRERLLDSVYVDEFSVHVGFGGKDIQRLSVVSRVFSLCAVPAGVELRFEYRRGLEGGRGGGDFEMTLDVKMFHLAGEESAASARAQLKKQGFRGAKAAQRDAVTAAGAGRALASATQAQLRMRVFEAYRDAPGDPDRHKWGLLPKQLTMLRDVLFGDTFSQAALPDVVLVRLLLAAAGAHDDQREPMTLDFGTGSVVGRQSWMGKEVKRLWDVRTPEMLEDQQEAEERAYAQYLLEQARRKRQDRAVKRQLLEDHEVSDEHADDDTDDSDGHGGRRRRKVRFSKRGVAKHSSDEEDGDSDTLSSDVDSDGNEILSEEVLRRKAWKRRQREERKRKKAPAATGAAWTTPSIPEVPTGRRSCCKLPKEMEPLAVTAFAVLLAWLVARALGLTDVAAALPI